MNSTSAIAANLESIRQQIGAAEQRYGRQPGSVILVAVSKTFGSAAIRAAAAAGQRRFGESYLQEALAKMNELQDLALEWHFIGPLQSNKTRQVAINFDWVHSVDRLKIAQRLNEARNGLPPLNICVQVNLGGEASKSGTTLAHDSMDGGGRIASGTAIELPDLAAAISLLPNLRLRGLMSIPPPTHDFSGQRQPFQQLREALEQLNRRGLALDTLSMGMSDDMEAAIAEGATLVRIGSAIFGTRQVV